MENAAKELLNSRDFTSPKQNIFLQGKYEQNVLQKEVHFQSQMKRSAKLECFSRKLKKKSIVYYEGKEKIDAVILC